MKRDRVARALATLRLPADATTEQVKASFRREARRWHPDRHYRDAEGAREAASRFRLAREAYDVLIAEGCATPTVGSVSRVSGNLNQFEIDEYANAVASLSESGGDDWRWANACAGVGLVCLSYFHYKPFFPPVLFLPLCLLALPSRGARIAGWLFVVVYAVGIPVIASMTGWPALACKPDCWLIRSW